MTDPAVLDRMTGALLGVHAGDSLGATVEFESWAAIRRRYPQGVRDVVGGGPFRWPAGHATDDTDLTRAVLLAHLDALVTPGQDVVRLAADRMLDWYEGRWPGREPGSRPRDAGGATVKGLERYRRSGDPRQAGAGAGAAGNGSLMRCLPTALAEPDPDRRVVLAVEISAVTHDDPRATAACAAYTATVAALVAGAEPEASVQQGIRIARMLRNDAVVGAVELGRSLSPAGMAATGQTHLPDEGAGYVLDSLSLAVAAVLDPRPLEDVLVDIVRLGHDTDTNGAIAGGLLGARDGAAAVPPRWRDRLQFADEFTLAARTLAARTLAAGP